LINDYIVVQVWRLWTNGSPLELVDLTISENCQTEEVIRCIHIALLCVQEDPKDRPNLSTIMMMLTNSSLILSVPQPPGFFVPQNKERDSFLSSQFTMGCTSQTKNDVTITNLDPRWSCCSNWQIGIVTENNADSTCEVLFHLKMKC